MARTEVPTSTAGDVLTAAWQNTYVKNNEAWHYQMLTPVICGLAAGVRARPPARVVPLS